eukprot:TRINITY_DN2859_c0_g1_i1.p1 TRINITY_DN2859_c0_g1~~TRINITY_DN2859_c0_g1_i1.p1  ORF type:complete len:356 (+),score=75.03 TRINITY_DN2859_c0_g1_i1:8-1075(+)
MRCGLALFRLQGQFGFQFGSGVAWHRSRRRSSVFVVVLMFSSMASQRAGMRLARTRMIHLIVVAAVVIFGRQTFDALGRLAFAGLASTGRRREQIRITSSTGLQAEPPRVVLSPIPKVYVYDHCPFCVRVRLALGLKNIKHEARFMMNDDQDTPISLLGKKIAPIWEHDGHVMGESMDIIKKVDSDAAFGEPGFFKPASGREDLKKWQSKFHAHMRILQRPRYVHESSVIPEFQQREAREYFIKGHLIPYPEDFDTATWTALDLATKQAHYEAALKTAGPALLAELNEGLKDLEPMVYSEDFCTEGGLSYDDIDLWSRLRSHTIIKGIQFPEKLRKYMDNLSIKGDVPLYWNIAV